MRSFLRFLVLLIFLSSCSKVENQDFRLSLKATECAGCLVMLTSYDPLYFEEIKLDSFYLDNNGLAKRKIRVEDLAQAYISIGESLQLPILLEKGESLEIKVQNKSPEFSGSLSKLNSVFNSIIRLTVGYENIDGKYILGLGLQEFFNRLDDYNKEATLVLDSAACLTKEERNVLEQVVQVKSLKYLYNYALMNYNFYSNKEIPKPISEIKEFPDFKDLLPFDYGFLAKAYLDMKVYPKVWPVTNNTDSIQFFRLRADSILRQSSFSKEVNDFIRAVNIKEELYSNKNIEVLKTLFYDYQQDALGSKYIAQLSAVYSKISKLKKGVQAPNIVGKNSFGEQIELSDLNGSTVVIDVWASWCKPCIQSFPKMDELENEFSSSGVKFLYVSLDQHEEQWTKANKKYLSNKLSILANDDNSLYEDYLVISLPRYMVIDSNGLIIDADAPSPSSEKLEEVIQSGLLD